MTKEIEGALSQEGILWIDPDYYLPKWDVPVICNTEHGLRLTKGHGSCFYATDCDHPMQNINITISVIGWRFCNAKDADPSNPKWYKTVSHPVDNKTNEHLKPIEPKPISLLEKIKLFFK